MKNHENENNYEQTMKIMKNRGKKAMIHNQKQ
jgi:hypothetical protein